MDKLKSTLGDAAMTYTVAGIGGDRASREVGEYLASTDDMTQKRWALGALSRSESTHATKILLEYAEHPQPALREQAIAGLARAPFTPEVGARLEAIAMNAQLDESQQIQAAGALAKIAAKNANHPEIQREAHSRLQRISAAPGARPGLKSEVKSILEVLQRP
jgi:hypothetical protein